MPMIIKTSLTTLQEATGAQPYGDPVHTEFDRICTRPEQVEGPRDLFIALREPGSDVAQAQLMALQRGAGGLLCEEPPTDDTHQATVLIVGDVHRAALNWFAAVLAQQEVVTLMLLGASDNGLTARTIAQVLAAEYSVQTLVPTAFTLSDIFSGFHLLPTTRLLIVDMPDDRTFNTDILQMLSPRIIIALAGHRIAPTTWAHCVGMLPAEGAVVAESPLNLPHDDLKVPLWTFTTDKSVTAHAVCILAEHTLQRSHVRVLTNGDERMTFTTSLLGESGLRAASVACVVGLLFDLSPQRIHTVLEKIQPPLCRLQPRTVGRNGRVLTLCEGSPHHASDIAWFLNASGEPTERIVILDDVRLVRGLTSDLFRHAASLAVNAVNLPTDWVAPDADMGTAPTEIRLYARHTDLLDWLKGKIAEGAAVLIIGEAGAGELAKALDITRPTLRSRETQGLGAARFTINLDAYAHNLQTLAQKNRNHQLILQLPANALNCGALPLATVAFDAGVKLIGVGVATEGMALRRAGLTGPVVIFGRITPEQIKPALAHNLALTITDPALLDTVLTIAERTRLTARLHIRLALSHEMRGVHPDDLLPMVRRIVRHKFATIEGLFAEQPTTLDPADSSLDWAQMQTFTRQLQAIKASGVHIEYVHLGSVGDLLRGESGTAVNAIRVREFALGVSTSPYTQVPSRLRRVVQWYTRIQHIEHIPEGTVINGKTIEKERVYAHIPVGYVDGLKQGWGYAVVNGQRAPIIGASDMYRSLLDVTRLTGHASIGDAVYLIDDRLNNVEAAALRLRTDPIHVLLAIRSEKAYIAT